MKGQYPSEISDAQTEELYRILGGHIYFQTLSAAVQLKLFDTLSSQGPMSRAQIAAQLKLPEKPVRILLLGCCALGLIEKMGDQYSNSHLAARLLVRSVPGNVVAIVEWQHFINYRPMYFFADAIKANRNVGLEAIPAEGETLYERLSHSPHLEEIFQNAMQAISVQANQMLAEHVDFSDVRHLVDVGGGNGTNIITLARKNPDLRASVFDSPTVCEIARENIARAGLSDRLDAVAGNCFETPFPTGADCLLFCHFLTIWSEERNRELLRKAHQALPSGGKVMVFNMMQDDDETGPLTAAMGSPYFLTLATGEGMLYTWDEYRSWMREAGFARVEIQELPRDHGVIMGIKT